jgi:hypothetical protein
VTITSIRQINNLAAFEVLVWKRENDQSVRLRPNEGIGTDMWIPWCSSQSDFDQNHCILIQKPEVVAINPDGTITRTPAVTFFTLWQKDNKVCVSLDGQWHSDCDGTPGTSTTGGDRRLRVHGASVTAVTMFLDKSW